MPGTLIVDEWEPRFLISLSDTAGCPLVSRAVRSMYAEERDRYSTLSPMTESTGVEVVETVRAFFERWMAPSVSAHVPARCSAGEPT